MGYFSEMALNKQEELGLPAEQVPAGDAFEDEETFDELPVPSASRSGFPCRGNAAITRI